MPLYDEGEQLMNEDVMRTATGIQVTVQFADQVPDFWRHISHWYPNQFRISKDPEYGDKITFEMPDVVQTSINYLNDSDIPEGSIRGLFVEEEERLNADD